MISDHTFINQSSMANRHDIIGSLKKSEIQNVARHFFFNFANEKKNATPPALTRTSGKGRVPLFSSLTCTLPCAYAGVSSLLSPYCSFLMKMRVPSALLLCLAAAPLALASSVRHRHHGYGGDNSTITVASTENPVSISSVPDNTAPPGE